MSGFVAILWAVALNNPFSQAAFLPEISLTGDFSLVWRSWEVENTHHHAHSHGMDTSEGFNFNYAELYIYAPADPYFTLTGVFSFSTHGVETEEAYASISPGWGITLQAGKFKSAFNRINTKHAHQWNFPYLPLILQAVFGPEGLCDVGLRVQWVLPLNAFVLTGVEVLQGEGEESFGWEGFETEAWEVKEAAVPNAIVGFLSYSFDVADVTLAMRASVAWGRHRRLDTEDNFAESAGGVLLGNGEMTLMVQTGAYTFFSLDGAFIFRRMRGLRAFNLQERPEAFSSLLSGGYLEGTWKFARRWKGSARVELLRDVKKREDWGFNVSAMLEIDPTEFSFLRLVYSWRSTHGSLEFYSGHEVLLQLNVSIGAHKAHSF